MMKTTYTVSTPLALTGCKNMRDLGGYPCQNGRVTAKSRFYRADCLSKLTEEDIALLQDLNVGCVIDLRHDHETGSAKNPLAGREGFAYYNISLIDGIQSQGMQGLMPESLAKMYVALVDGAGESICSIMRIFLAHADTAVVFHCTAGKDRTGVIAALLLLLAGVEEDAVIADYAKTYELMKPVFDEQISMAKRSGAEVPEHLMLSEPAFMQELVSHIKEKYVSVQQYLKQIGLSEDEIENLKDMLTEGTK